MDFRPTIRCSAVGLHCAAMLKIHNVKQHACYHGYVSMFIIFKIDYKNMANKERL